MKTAQRLNLRKSGLAALAGFVLAGSAVAHHGFGSYLEDEFTLTGVVVDMFFGFPHPHVMVEVEGERWDVWLAAFGRVRFACFDGNVLSVGDQVTAVGRRVPDMDRLEMKAMKVTLGEMLYDFYPPENPLGGNPNPKRTDPCPT